MISILGTCGIYLLLVMGTVSNTLGVAAIDSCSREWGAKIYKNDKVYEVRGEVLLDGNIVIVDETGQMEIYKVIGSID
jgi:hypothetical protein